MEKSKELIYSITKKDLRIDYFSGRGAGGQHRNKHQNCVRIFHPESGTIVTGQSHRERQANIREAFNNLVKDTKFKIWYNRRINDILAEKSIDDIVEEMMDTKNLKIENKIDGKWTEIE